MTDHDLQFYDRDALLDRLSDGVSESGKEVVFVVGSPITAPYGGNNLGVANVQAVVELIRDQFSAKPSRLAVLDADLTKSDNRYQAAFKFLSGTRGQNAANKIVKQAVASALIAKPDQEWKDAICKLSDEQIADLDKDFGCWHLSPGADALGQLIAEFPSVFGKSLVTSNFDPLIEIAISRHGGTSWRTSLSTDGSLDISTADGCQVIHIHGYWHGSDTLHTGQQLLAGRPTLKNSLLKLLENKIVVVLAYGGWPDIFTGALNGLVSNNTCFPEILWTTYETQPQLSDYLFGSLSSGIARNRVTFYEGIDCHTFVPDLLKIWQSSKTDNQSKVGPIPNRSADDISLVAREDVTKLFRSSSMDCDRPPSIDVWVGREAELRSLETSTAKVIAICGIGGQGKSVLAARYLKTAIEETEKFVVGDWRDCKEQGDRIRTQISDAIVRFSIGNISAIEIAQLSDIELVNLLIDVTRYSKAIFVFDNVDNYVDLENKTFIGILDELVRRFANTDTSSRLIITCRPDISYTSSGIITFSMRGISLEEAIELFHQRADGITIDESEIREAHELTDGHAFWLDLMAIQVSKVPGMNLKILLEDVRRGRGDGPDVLSSIWDTLAPREQTVLRFMAETMRPETENTIEKFVASELNYNKFKKSMKSLITLNLIVVKPENNAPDLYDLHPLVRQFVRTRFEKNERNGFIRVVLNQYEIIIGAIESMLGAFLPLPMLERWSQKAELQISAGLYEQAFDTLYKVEDAMIGGGHVEEFVRTARILFEAIDWETAPTKFKRFDRLVAVTVNSLDQLGQYGDADELLSRFEQTIPKKTARFIGYCDIRAYSNWIRLDFAQAIEWASKGVELKNQTNVDTTHDCGHTLALAQRDNGDAQTALKYFLKGHNLHDLTDPASSVAEDDGPTLGNVGRCLHLMGNFKEALNCYGKSIRALQNDGTSDRVGNKAYARQWIGEVLEQEGEHKLAIAFLRDAVTVLGKSSPIRTTGLLHKIDQLVMLHAVDVNSTEAAKIVDRWIRQ